MNASSLHIVFTGGGTGGHLFPGLAVAEELRERVPDVRITFAGSGKEFERRHVVAAGFEYLAVPCRPLPRAAREALAFLMDNLAGYLTARRFLDTENVAAVVGLGGYASVPMGRAAGRRGVPLVLLEQNAVPGKATRWLARGASLVCLAMEQSRFGLRCGCPVYVTGTPIRHRVASDRAKRPSRKRLVVLGGSGGARVLNETVPLALHRIRGRLDGWRIVHQSGEAGLDATRNLYNQLGLKAKVAPFFNDLPSVLAESDLAVCRAGGTTLAELAVYGVPAILLPYPHAADDHQRRNAEVFARAGGAILLDQRELPGRLDDHLAAGIGNLAADAPQRAEMRRAMLELAQPDAAALVASHVLALAHGQADWPGLPAAA